MLLRAEIRSEFFDKQTSAANQQNQLLIHKSKYQ